MKKLIFCAFAAVTLLSSCKKNNDECKLSETAVVGTFKVTSATANGVSIPLSQLMDACELDDTYTFNADKSFKYTDAGVICNPSETYTATWSFSGNTLTFDGDGYNVESFDCNTVALGQSFNGAKYVTTFTRQ